MKKTLTKREVMQMFKEDIMPGLIKQYGKDDRDAKAETWNNYTDSLCTDGYITRKQCDNWANPY